MVMVKQEPFTIEYAEAVKEHLRWIEAKYHSQIRSEIENQLRFNPAVETRNRKPLLRPIVEGADWELRLGPNNRFRVFYQVDTHERVVTILAIGIKDRNRLNIGGEEIEL
jgi:mRNA-degrading endonuclease RelE of RelBE toxin-antitoxin system